MTKRMKSTLLATTIAAVAALATGCGGGNPADGTYKSSMNNSIVEIDGTAIRSWMGEKDGDPAMERVTSRYEVGERSDGSPKWVKFYDENDQEVASLNISKGGEVSIPFVPGSLQRID